MSSDDFERTQTILRSFIGKTLSSIECDKLQLELTFHDESQFRTQSPWRVIQEDSLLFGGGDIGGQISKDVFGGLIGLKVVSTSISKYWDTDLRFDKNYVVQTISDSVQYETWDAHLDEDWVIFSDGQVTVFPRAPVAPTEAGTP